MIHNTVTLSRVCVTFVFVPLPVALHPGSRWPGAPAPGDARLEYPRLHPRLLANRCSRLPASRSRFDDALPEGFVLWHRAGLPELSGGAQLERGKRLAAGKGDPPGVLRRGRDVTQAAVLAGLANGGASARRIRRDLRQRRRRVTPPPISPGSRTSASPGSPTHWPNATANWRCSPTAYQLLAELSPLSRPLWAGTGRHGERGDRLSWAEIRRLALRHKETLLFANLVAGTATLCTVPIPLAAAAAGGRSAARQG